MTDRRTVVEDAVGSMAPALEHPDPGVDIGPARAEPLRLCVERTLEHYLHQLDGEQVSDLYDLVLAEVELPLLETVMAHVGNNQSRAAEMLGLNRGTLRKKLKQHGLL